MNVGKDTGFFAAFLSLRIFLYLSPHCLHNEQHSTGAVIYAWIIFLLLLEQCFKTADKASVLPPACGHACTWTHAPFLSPYFPLLISHPSCLHVWAVLYMRETPPVQREFFWAWAKGGSASLLPPCHSTKPLKLGHELCHLVRVKLLYHLGLFQRLRSPMDCI